MTAFYRECGRRHMTDAGWGRCVLALGHDGRCSDTIDSREQVQYRASWRRWVGTR